MEKESLVVHWRRKTKKSNVGIYKLWKECFGDSDKYLDYYDDWVMKSNTVLGLYKDETLASMIHLNPYMVSFLGEHSLFYYIVGVATKECYRKQGLMRKLMLESFQWMYKENVPYAYLCPIDKAIYTPFDFKVVEEYPLWNEYMMETTMKESEEITKEITTHGLMDESVWSSLSNFANDILHNKYDIYIPRSSKYFEELSYQLQCCGGGFLILRRENRIIGYVAFMNDETYHIVEMLCNNGMEELLLYHTRMEYERFHRESVKNGERKINTFAGSIMGRIISLEDYVKLLRCEMERSFCANIIDNEIPENTGIYQITIGKEYSESIRTDKRPEITFTIGEFMIHCQGKYTTFIHDVV